MAKKTKKARPGRDPKTYTVLAWGDRQIEVLQGVPGGEIARAQYIAIREVGESDDSPNWMAIESPAWVHVRPYFPIKKGVRNG